MIILDIPTKIFLGFTPRRHAHFKDTTFFARKKKKTFNIQASVGTEVLSYFRVGLALHGLINLSFSLGYYDFEAAALLNPIRLFF